MSASIDGDACLEFQRSFSAVGLSPPWVITQHLNNSLMLVTALHEDHIMQRRSGEHAEDKTLKEAGGNWGCLRREQFDDWVAEDMVHGL